jgi:hypothetical protein
MFDIARITDTIGGLLGQSGQSLLNGDLVQQLGALGVDHNLLDGISSEELTSLLAERGIDIAGLDAQQISELLGSLQGGAPMADTLSSLISDRFMRG